MASAEAEIRHVFGFTFSWQAAPPVSGTQAVTRGGKLKIIYAPVRRYDISLSASASLLQRRRVYRL